MPTDDFNISVSDAVEWERCFEEIERVALLLAKRDLGVDRIPYIGDYYWTDAMMRVKTATKAVYDG